LDVIIAFGAWPPVAVAQLWIVRRIQTLKNMNKAIPAITTTDAALKILASQPDPTNAELKAVLLYLCGRLSKLEAAERKRIQKQGHDDDGNLIAM
jgi:hypothetical protein